MWEWLQRNEDDIEKYARLWKSCRLTFCISGVMNHSPQGHIWSARQFMNTNKATQKNQTKRCYDGDKRKYHKPVDWHVCPGGPSGRMAVGSRLGWRTCTHIHTISKRSGRVKEQTVCRVVESREMFTDMNSAAGDCARNRKVSGTFYGVGVVAGNGTDFICRKSCVKHLHSHITSPADRFLTSVHVCKQLVIAGHMELYWTRCKDKCSRTKLRLFWMPISFWFYIFEYLSPLVLLTAHKRGV